LCVCASGDTVVNLGVPLRALTLLFWWLINNLEQLCPDLVTWPDPELTQGNSRKGRLIREITLIERELGVVLMIACLQPGGSLFFTTISRTLCSYGLAVVAAERLLRLVPHDAHDWNKFVLPAELKDLVTQSIC